MAILVPNTTPKQAEYPNNASIAIPNMQEVLTLITNERHFRGEYAAASLALAYQALNLDWGWNGGVGGLLGVPKIGDYAWLIDQSASQLYLYTYVLNGPGAANAWYNNGIPYTLPPATTTVIGGVMPGTGLSVQANGTMDVEPATTTVIGGVKTGNNIAIAADGTISGTREHFKGEFVATSLALAESSLNAAWGWNGGAGGTWGIPSTGDFAWVLDVSTMTLYFYSYCTMTGPYLNTWMNNGIPYTLPPATATIIGGVKTGANIAIAPDGTISGVPERFKGEYVAATLNDAYNDLNTAWGWNGGAGGSQGIPANGDFAYLVDQSAGQLYFYTFVITGPGAANAWYNNGGVPLSPATTATLGGVIVGTGLSVQTNGTLDLAPGNAGVIGGVKTGTNVNIDSDGTIHVAAPVANDPILETSGDDINAVVTYSAVEAIDSKDLMLLGIRDNVTPLSKTGVMDSGLLFHFVKPSGTGQAAYDNDQATALFYSLSHPNVITLTNELSEY